MIKSSEHKEIIKLRRLSRKEEKEVREIKKFKEFGPVECTNCGFKGPFTRKIFLVEGLSDDTSHGLTKMYLRDEYNLENCAFRLDGDREFAEGSICPKCNSSRITYDISKKVFWDLMKDSKKKI